LVDAPVRVVHVPKKDVLEEREEASVSIMGYRSVIGFTGLIVGSAALKPLRLGPLAVLLVR
jgi:hypothetical protein